MSYDCDVIVIGSGAGGATFAYACAEAGKNVLLLERGHRYHPSSRHVSPAADERAMLIEKKPYDDRPVEVNGTSKGLYVGGVLGGGTSLYGGALLRPSLDDFRPGERYGSRLPRELWEWPIDYNALEPHYTRAERLMQVAGEVGDEFGPLKKPESGYVKRPLPLHPANQKLIVRSRAIGCNPFRLPLAIDPDNCLRCGACAGYVCPTGARRSAGQLVDEAQARGWPLNVLTGIDVERLEFGTRGLADGVHVVDRVTGRHAVYRARCYALAAGAIHSPLLLFRSGEDHPLVGRNYMTHLSPIVAGVFKKKTGAESTFVKQVGFSDFYFGTKTTPEKLGLVQSLPVPGPLLAAKAAPRGFPRWLINFLRRRMLPLAGIVEDLPNPANHVSIGSGGQPCITHHFGEYDLERGRMLGRLMARILKAAGAAFCLPTQFASDEHVAHQCGTLRFGRNSFSAILDENCRSFRHPNVFAVDGSFFPTSLGVGPALTIMANALRVAQVVAMEA
jgi:choline dehydrogenase-like flavoprotein